MNDLLVRFLQLILPRQFWYRKVYLRSKHWRMTRYKKFQSVASVKCERCKSKKLPFDIHHKRYYDEKGKSILWHERLSDLQILCRECHERE